MKNKIKIPIILIIIPVFLIAVISPLRVLKITGENNEGVLIVLNRENDLTIKYIHSIYHVLQKEFYNIESDEIILRKMYFEDYQAANYYDPYLVKTMKYNDDGSFELENINKKFDDIKFALGHRTEYSIIINDKEINLNETFINTTFLTIDTERISYLDYIVWRIKNADRN